MFVTRAIQRRKGVNVLTEAAVIHPRYQTGGYPTLSGRGVMYSTRTSTTTLIMTQITAAWSGPTGVSRRISRSVRQFLPWLNRKPRRPRRSLADRTTEIVVR